MVVHHHILDYSIIIHQIIHSFEIYTSKSLNLLKLLLWKWFTEMITKRFISIWSRKKSWWLQMSIYISRKKLIFTELVIYSVCSIKKRFYTFTRLVGNLWATHSRVADFIVRDMKSLNGIFSIFPLAELIKP